MWSSLRLSFESMVPTLKSGRALVVTPLNQHDFRKEGRDILIIASRLIVCGQHTHVCQKHFLAQPSTGQGYATVTLKCHNLRKPQPSA